MVAEPSALIITQVHACIHTDTCHKSVTCTMNSAVHTHTHIAPRWWAMEVCAYFTDLVHSCVGKQQCRVFMGDDTAGVDILVGPPLNEVVHKGVPYLGAWEVRIHWRLRGKWTTVETLDSKRTERREQMRETKTSFCNDSRAKRLKHRLACMMQDCCDYRGFPLPTSGHYKFLWRHHFCP